jgi:ATP synthase protein I
VTSDSHSVSDSPPPSGDDLGPVPRNPLPRPDLEQRQAQFRDRLQRRVARRQRAQQDKQGLLFGLGMFGIVGWSVAIPTLLGIALGIWIDRRWPSPYSWTLMLLFGSVILGCLNAWYWIDSSHRSS